MRGRPVRLAHQPLIENSFSFFFAELRGTEGHLGGLQGVLGRITSRQIVDRVREAGADGTAVWAICFLDEIVHGLPTSAVREELRGLAQGDIHFVRGCAKASEKRQDGQRIQVIKEGDAVERTVQHAMAPAELAFFRPAVRRIRIADEVAAKVQQR